MAFPAEIKGGYLLIRPVLVVVTSQYTIKEVFAEARKEDVDAISRRFTMFEVAGFNKFALGVPPTLEEAKKMLLKS